MVPGAGVRAFIDDNTILFPTEVVFVSKTNTAEAFGWMKAQLLLESMPLSQSMSNIVFHGGIDVGNFSDEQGLELELMDLTRR